MGVQENFKQPWWSKILEKIFESSMYIVIFGGIVLFALFSLWPVISCLLGLCTYEITPIGEGDCNPNWTGVGAC